MRNFHWLFHFILSEIFIGLFVILISFVRLNKEHDEWQEILDHHIEKEKESKA